jgi:hypothetical protein
VQVLTPKMTTTAPEVDLLTKHTHHLRAQANWLLRTPGAMLPVTQCYGSLLTPPDSVRLPRERP